MSTGPKPSAASIVAMTADSSVMSQGKPSARPPFETMSRARAGERLVGVDAHHSGTRLGQHGRDAAADVRARADDDGGAAGQVDPEAHRAGCVTG
jgi:hypothetical protein